MFRVFILGWGLLLARLMALVLGCYLIFIGSHTRIRVSYYVQGINIRFSGLILGSRILYIIVRRWIAHRGLVDRTAVNRLRHGY